MSLKETYITAVINLLDTKADFAGVVAGLRHALTARGHEQLERSILEGLARNYQARNVSSAVLTVAARSAVEKYTKEIITLTKNLNSASVIINPDIVGGYIYEESGIRHDASYKSALLKLYRQITN